MELGGGTIALTLQQDANFIYYWFTSTFQLLDQRKEATQFSKPTDEFIRWAIDGPPSPLFFLLFLFVTLATTTTKNELLSPDESETITSKFVKLCFKRQLLPLLFVLQLGAMLNMPAVS